MDVKKIIVALLASALLTGGGFAAGQLQGDPLPSAKESLFTPKQSDYVARVAAARLGMLAYNSGVNLDRVTGGTKGLDSPVTQAEKYRHERLYLLLKQGAADTELTDSLIANEISMYEGDKIQAKSAPQASQVAEESTQRLALFQVAQNERIIELLDQIAKQRQSSPDSKPGVKTAPKAAGQ